jgi:site-specific recombinase
MRSIETSDTRIASLMDAGNPGGSDTESTDIVVRLQDGRRFSLNLLTVRVLERHLETSLSCVLPSALVVKSLSDEAIRHAVSAALDQGLERFGTLQAPLEE